MIKVDIYTLDGEHIARTGEKFELRRNQVDGWFRINNEGVIRLHDIATIKIEDMFTSISDNMRDATPEERNGIDDYIKSISELA